MARKRSQIARSRAEMYKWAKILGDVRAVQTNHIWRRILRRFMGNRTSRLLRQFFH